MEDQMDDDTYNSLVEDCASCVPTSWLDPLLTGAGTPKLPLDEPSVERLLRGVAERIRALKADKK
jgi:hypothetical protein